MILVLLLLGLAVVLAVRALSATAEMARRMSAVENRARHIEEELSRLRRSGALPADIRSLVAATDAQGAAEAPNRTGMRSQAGPPSQPAAPDPGGGEQ